MLLNEDIEPSFEKQQDSTALVTTSIITIKFRSSIAKPKIDYWKSSN